MKLRSAVIMIISFALVLHMCLLVVFLSVYFGCCVMVLFSFVSYQPHDRVIRLDVMY